MLTGIARTLEGSSIALAINQSRYILGGLSGAHLIGFVLVIGTALIANGRLVGLIFARQPVPDVLRPARRGLIVGLTLSIVTGTLLFAPRAQSALENWIFLLKMTLLATAIVVQFAIYVSIGRLGSDRAVTRVAGAVGLCLWLSVALAGCAFILIE